MDKQDNFRLYILLPVLIAIYETSAYLANDMYLPALPTIQAYLNSSIENAQDTISIWFLGTSLFQFIIGPLADRYGRRPVLFSGTVIFLLGSILCATSVSIEQFYLGRFLQGLMVPTCIITSYAIIHEFLPTRKAIQVLAWMGSIVIIGPAIGPLFGSFVLEFAGWQMIFWVLLITAIVPAIGLYKVMPESKNIGKEHQIDFIKIFKRYASLFANKNFMCFTLIFAINLFPPISWIVAGPFLVIKKYGMKSADFSIIQIQVFGAYAVSCLIANKLIEKTSIKRMLFFGQKICLFGSLFCLCLSFVYENNLDIIVASLVLFSIGNAFVLAVSNRMAIESSSFPKGVVVSGYSMIISIATTFISKFITEVYDFGITEFCFYIATFAIISSILVFVVKDNVNESV